MCKLFNCQGLMDDVHYRPLGEGNICFCQVKREMMAQTPGLMDVLVEPESLPRIALSDVDRTNQYQCGGLSLESSIPFLKHTLQAAGAAAASLRAC